MQKDLLNSVVQITRHRDVDSLEISLLTTLQEFIETKHVILFKLTLKNAITPAEIRAELVRTKEGVYEWKKHRTIDNISKELECCVESACSICIQDKSGTDRRWLPVVTEDKVQGVIYIESAKLDFNQQVMLNAFCRIYENYLNILNESERDKLTGLLNRQTFDRKIKSLMESQISNRFKPISTNDIRKRKSSECSWLAIIDIDYFKQVNDTYGHVCGDEVLLTLAQKLTAFFRTSDLIFRFGGEEFVIVFEPTTEENITARLNELQNYIRSSSFPFVEHLTLSVGYTRMSPYEFPTSVIECADKALYYAKEHGRDQIVLFDDIDNVEEKVSQGNDVELF